MSDLLTRDRSRDAIGDIEIIYWSLIEDPDIAHLAARLDRPRFELPLERESGVIETKDDRLTGRGRSGPPARLL
ncbi:MAG: hypothetical protein N0A16_11425 [Blastocatellia bacterium]|nr:hypothetical protein [Blastocatellia bacterium]MDW8169481.1 hypothetical protein [Acidobacteriota bacterium]